MYSQKDAFNVVILKNSQGLVALLTIARASCYLKGSSSSLVCMYVIMLFLYIRLV